VSEREVVELFSNAPLKLRVSGDAYMASGQTDGGRYLKTIYREETYGIFVITAYDLRGKALAAYKRRRRGKGRQ